MKHLKNTYVINLVLGLLIVVALGILTFLVQTLLMDRSIFERWGNNSDVATTTDSAELEEDDYIPPPFTDELKQQLEASAGFDYLISYSDNGFEPPELNIKSGETVRFVNNSSNLMRLAKEGEDASECTEEELNICRVYSPLEFAEVTFDQSGNWIYDNRISTSTTNSIVINVE